MPLLRHTVYRQTYARPARRVGPLILLLSVLLCRPFAATAEEPVRLYIDADWTGTRASSEAIERGIRVALDEADGLLAGRPVEVVTKNHHGNTRRSKKHLDEYLTDTQALAIFSGLHSPPLLANRDFINQSRILVLDPWAAAGPITRFPAPENWIFRLSVDDTKAGIVISQFALKRGFRRPALLLEDTGWGKSNHRTMTAALARENIDPTDLQWFNWNIGKAGARMILRDIIDAGADVIFLVANAPEGKTFAQAMVSLPPSDRIPICSHWGITGGDFASVINAEIRQELDLTFLQTSFSFISQPDNLRGRAVLDRARTLFPEEINSAADIEAPSGFIHAYDLTKLLMAAVSEVGLTGTIETDRLRVRAALEKIAGPVPGLIKDYRFPFTVFRADNPDAHEALGAADLVMARFAADGTIVLEEDR